MPSLHLSNVNVPLWSDRIRLACRGGVHTDCVSLVELLLQGDADSDLFYRAVDSANAADVDAVLALASHTSLSGRRAVALTLPLLTGGDSPSSHMVGVIITLSLDLDARVRDYACMALGEQFREVDTPELRPALIARLDDIDFEVRCEALVGLAYRQDPAALPRVKVALSRPNGDVWRAELIAAGALSHPDLHDLVLRHQEAWDDSDAATTADAARRLTDPAGPGEDVIHAVAELYRSRAHGLPTDTSMWAWQLMDVMLDIAPYRAPGFLWAVLARLHNDPDALDEVQTRSALAQLAQTHTENCTWTQLSWSRNRPLNGARRRNVNWDEVGRRCGGLMVSEVHGALCLLGSVRDRRRPAR